MKLVFGKMKIHNFLSFKDDEIDFSENRRMTLVCGRNNDVKDSKNGSGKSATFAALLYCLFGELQNKINIQNLRNRYVDSKDMTVDLDFNVENLHYHITRGLNKYGMSYVALYKEENGEMVDVTRSSIAETNSYIENEVLNCDISIFLRTIFLSSDQNYNFFRLKPQPKRDFIEKLFNISIFGDMFNLIHRDILQYDKTIFAKQNRLLLLNNTENDYSKRMQKFIVENAEILTTLKDKLDNVLKEYNELKGMHVESNEKEVQKYEDALTKLYEADSKIKISLKETQQKSLKASKTKCKLESTKEVKQKAIDQYSDLLGKLCDKCSPIVSDYYDLSKFSKEIDELNIKIAEIDSQLSSLTDESVKGNEKLDKISTSIGQINRKISELTSKANDLKLKQSKYESQIQILEKEYDKAKNSKNPYKELFEKNHEEIVSESKELEDISSKYNYLKYAESIVSQDTLKKFIIKDLVQLLNVKIKYYLTRLGSNYTCVFDENMDYEFITEGGTCDYDNFSSGERMRLMIAASFAFKDFMSTRSNITSNILILDEFIDSNIDTVAIENIMKILQEFSMMYNQSVYVISHRKEIDNSIFDSIIQIVKNENISKITYLPNEKS